MSFSVRERADVVATLRYISVYMMETLARWVPSTPELEVKVLFGRQLWDFAQHADAWGGRTAELRVGLHCSRDPSAEFQKVLEQFAGAEATLDRVSGLLDGMIPVLVQLHQEYMDRTDPVMDEPSVRIAERVLSDYTRMVEDRQQIAEAWPDLAGNRSPSADALSGASVSIASAVDFRPAPQPAGA